MPEPPHVKFPNETLAYRQARNVLLEQELALKRQIEKVAQLRRALPPGGELLEDYVFEKLGPNYGTVEVRFSELFEEGKNSLALYSFMYGPDREYPCTGCTHFLDSLDGAAQHIMQRTNFYVVAKSPLHRIMDLARSRGWQHLRFLSTAGNTYDADYFGDSSKLPHAVRVQSDFKDDENDDMPILNVFKKEDNVIRHFWGSELLYVRSDPGQDVRHNDLMDPLWNFFDTLPEGRGDFWPKLEYREEALSH